MSEEIKKVAPFAVAVKSLGVARRIAKAVRDNGSPEAATAYLAKFEVRESIEIAARDNVLGNKA